MVLVRPAGLELIAERADTSTRIPVDSFLGFWDTLAPRNYRLSVEGLEPGFTVRSFSAGSVNLLEQPFTVPIDRPAETIRLELNYEAEP